MESTRSLHGVYTESTRSLHRLQLIFSIVHMESTRSLHGVYMESTRTPCRLHAFTWTIHGVYVVDSAWSLHGVYTDYTNGCLLNIGQKEMSQAGIEPQPTPQTK